jgi:hypothetical protein
MEKYIAWQAGILFSVLVVKADLLIRDAFISK